MGCGELVDLAIFAREDDVSGWNSCVFLGSCRNVLEG